MREVRYNHNSRMHNTLAHTAQVVLQTTNPTEMLEVTPLLYNLLSYSFIFLFVFFSWARWRFFCMRNTWQFRESFSFDGLLRVGPEDWDRSDLHWLALVTLAKTLEAKLSPSSTELPLPNLAFPNCYGTTCVCTPTKWPFRSRLKHICLILHMDEITGSPQLMTITQK